MKYFFKTIHLIFLLLSLSTLPVFTIEVTDDVEQLSPQVTPLDESYNPDELYPLDDCMSSSIKAWEDGFIEKNRASFFYALKTAPTMRRMEKKLKYLQLARREILEKAIPNVDYLCKNFVRFLEFAKDFSKMVEYSREKKLFDANLDRLSGIIKIDKIVKNAEKKLGKIGQNEEKKIWRIKRSVREKIGDFSTRDLNYLILDDAESFLHDKKLHLDLRIIDLFESEKKMSEFFSGIDIKISKIIDELKKEKSAELIELLTEIDKLQVEMRQVQGTYSTRLDFLTVLKTYTPEELLDYITQNQLVFADNCSDCDLLKSTEIDMKKRALKIDTIKKQIDQLPQKYKKIFKKRTHLLTLVMDISSSLKNEYVQKISQVEKKISVVTEKIQFIQSVLSVNRENLSAGFWVDWIDNTPKGDLWFCTPLCASSIIFSFSPFFPDFESKLKFDLPFFK